MHQIILVDDMPDIRADMRSILNPPHSAKSRMEALIAGKPLHSAARFAITEANQGEEAIRLIAESDICYDLAIIDMRMPPGIDGAETISRLRATGFKSPIIACSAFSDQPIEQIFQANGGPLTILQKPYHADELLAAVHSALEAQADVGGKHTRMLRSGDTDPATYDGLWGAVLTGSAWTGEVKNRKKDGASVWLQSSISPILENGDVVAFAVIYQSIEAEKRAQEASHHAAVAAARQDVLRGTVHNIGNILVLFQDEKIRETINSIVAIIDTTQSHAKSLDANSATEFYSDALLLVQDIAIEAKLAASNMARGATDIRGVIQSCRQQLTSDDPQFERVKLGSIINSVIAQTSIGTRDGTVDVAISELPEDDYITAPVSYLHQILHNLIKNAREAIVATKQERGCITIGAKVTDDGFSLRVRDNGGGIENIDLMFRQGYTTKTQGTGIGLHNSANLARSIGGNLTVANINQPPGAEFTLNIPSRHRQKRVTH